MSAKAVEVVRVQATVSYVFAADNSRSRAPFDQEIGAALGKEMSAADVIVQPGQRPAWILRHGTCRFSESRRVVCESIVGTAHELTASVDGPTDDAKDVLNEVWSRLGELTNEDSVDLTEYLGVFAFSTTAIVHVPGGFQGAFPGIDVLSKCAHDKLGNALVQRPGVLRFRVELPVELAVRGLNVQRSFLIEPRFTAEDGDRVYFTVSPLSSPDHIEVLEQLGAVRSTAP